jgi:pimeloyl-ACP methyl ester carboxylesterase
MPKRTKRTGLSKVRRATRAGDRRDVVLILPGIMGSELDDLQDDGFGRIWIDALGVLRGELAHLRLAPDGAADANPAVRIRATDVIDRYYDPLKRRLKKHFDARHFPFDWRHSLGELAGRLADYIARDVPADRPLSLVAHSMGGLVSRTLFAAHPQAAGRVNHLIMLGTPNFGSYSPAQVFSGDETLVRIVAGLDLVNSSAALTAVFASFPGLVAMLPNPRKVAGDEPDFLRPATWPAEILPAAALRRAEDQQRRLLGDIPARSRYTLIAGSGRETVAHAKMIAPGQFKFSDGDGDGTVPLQLCLLPNIGRLYFTGAKHGAMPADDDIVEAVFDILSGNDAKLPKTVPLQRSVRTLRPHTVPVIEIPDYIERARARTRHKSPAARRRAADRLIARLTPRQRREIDALTRQAAEDFVAAPAKKARPAAKKATATKAAAAALPPDEGQVRRLLIKTVLGSVTAARSSTLAIGVFPAVKPQGAVAALDELVGGYVTKLFQQGAIHGGAGEVMFLPTPGASVPAELALLVGLGEPRAFTASTLERVGENLARALCQLRVPEIATIAIGSGNMSLTSTLGALLRGFLIGLAAVDPDSVFRSITLCEIDKRRLAEIRRILHHSLEDWRAQGVELELKELPPLPQPPQARRPYSDLAYWIETVPEGLRVFLMGAAVNLEKSIATSTRRLAADVLELQSAMESDRTDAQKVAHQRRFGAQLAGLVPRELAVPMLDQNFEQARLDLAESAAMVPWELIRVRGQAAALRLPLVRRLGISADHRPAANYMLPDQRNGKIRIAIVADPTDDLPGAREEGELLAAELQKNPAYEVTRFIGSLECQERTVLDLICAGAVDVLHYAGHGCFNPDKPETSGLFINGEPDGILTAAEIRRAQRPPLLMFTNACQVGIVPPKLRKKPKKKRRPKSSHRRLRMTQPYGFAESLLNIGVRAYIGTFWSIPDPEAKTFALEFHRAIGAGATLGAALLRARSETEQAGPVGRWAWASYMLYGPAWFQLFHK